MINNTVKNKILRKNESYLNLNYSLPTFDTGILTIVVYYRAITVNEYYHLLIY